MTVGSRQYGMTEIAATSSRTASSLPANIRVPLMASSGMTRRASRTLRAVSSARAGTSPAAPARTLAIRAALRAAAAANTASSAGEAGVIACPTGRGRSCSSSAMNARCEDVVFRRIPVRGCSECTSTPNSSDARPMCSTWAETVTISPR